MTHFIYEILDRLGYSHPIHPVLVHMPVGMTVGAFCLFLASVVLKRKELMASSYHVIVIALLFVLVAIPTGVMDWQRYYGGAWLFEIKVKLALAGSLLLLLVIAAIAGRRPGAYSWVLPLVYFLGVLNVAGLGFLGGQLVYSGRVPTAPVAFGAGKAVFDSHCSGCHGRGGNIFMPNLPLRSAPQLQAYEDFAKFVRDPRMPNGTQGVMPKFGPETVNDEDLKKLYDYIRFAFVTPKREAE